MKLSLSTVLIPASLILFASPALQAEESNFIGLSLSMGVDYTRNHIDYGGFLAGKKGKENDVGLKLDASYGFSVAPQWIFTLGANYEPTHSDFGSIDFISLGDSYTLSAKEKNHYSLYVSPGYLISPDWLVYGKLAWHHVEGKFTDTLPNTGKTQHHGLGWGIGVAHTLTEHIEARAEIEKINLSRESYSKSNGKPDSTEAAVYLGYRF